MVLQRNTSLWYNDILDTFYNTSQKHQSAIFQFLLAYTFQREMILLSFVISLLKATRS